MRYHIGTAAFAVATIAYATTTNPSIPLILIMSTLLVASIIHLGRTRR